MKIDVRSENCVYIEMNGKTFYIDDSTGESIMDVWDNDNPVDQIDDPIDQIDDMMNHLFPKDKK